MATIVFSGGHELKVREEAAAVIRQASAAADRSEKVNLEFTDGKKLAVEGWFTVTDGHGALLPVRPETIAYVLP